VFNVVDIIEMKNTMYAGMYAVRSRRKTVTEKDFLDAVNKVIKGYQKFSATPKYMVYN
jgi:26S proteasome regulatory subunit T1